MATDFLGKFLKISTIGLMIYYARAVAKGKAFHWHGLVFQPREDISFFLAFAFLILSVLLLAAWMLYLSQRGILRLAMQYEQHCLAKILQVFQNQHGLPLELHSAIFRKQQMIRLPNRTPRTNCRVVLILLHGLNAAVIFIISFATLLYIDWFLTMLLLGLMLCSGYFFYRANLEGVTHSRQLYATADQASRKKKAFLEQFASSTFFPSACRKPWEQILTDQLLALNRSSFEGRLLTLEKSGLIYHLLLACGFFMIFLVLGYQVFTGDKSWTRPLIYLLALRYSMNNLHSITRLVTSINRFYPQLKSYFLFIKQAENLVQQAAESSPSGLTSLELRVAASDFPDTLRRWQCRPGAPVLLISAWSLDRYYLLPLLQTLCPTNGQWQRLLTSCWFVSDKISLPTTTLAALLNLSPQENWNSLAQPWANCTAWEAVRQIWRDDLNRVVSAQTLAQLSPSVSFSLGLWAAWRSQKPWLFLGGKSWLALCSADQTFFAHLFQKHHLFFVVKNPPSYVGRHGEHLVGLLYSDELKAMGSVVWYQYHLSYIKQHWQHLKEGQTTVNITNDEDEFQDEELLD